MVKFLENIIFILFLFKLDRRASEAIELMSDSPLDAELSHVSESGMLGGINDAAVGYGTGHVTVATTSTKIGNYVWRKNWHQIGKISEKYTLPE